MSEDADMDWAQRWARARAEWAGFHRRDLISGAVATAIAVGVLALLGFPADTLIEVGVVAGAAVIVGVGYPVAQLASLWLQAPMRMLMEEVMEIRRYIENVAAPVEPKRLVNAHLTLLNHVRHANEMDLASITTNQKIQQWTDEAVQALAEMATPEEVKLFLEAASWDDRVTLLRQFAEAYPVQPDR